MHPFTATLTNGAANAKPFSSSVPWWVFPAPPALFRSLPLSFSFFRIFTALLWRCIQFRQTRALQSYGLTVWAPHHFWTSFLIEHNFMLRHYFRDVNINPAHSEMGWKAQNNSILIYICNLHTTFIARHTKHRVPHNQKWWWWADDAAYWLGGGGGDGGGDRMCRCSANPELRTNFRFFIYFLFFFRFGTVQILRKTVSGTSTSTWRVQPGPSIETQNALGNMFHWHCEW